MKYLVTKEIKSDTQVVWKLYFRDFIFLVIWIAVNLYLKNIIHTYLQIPFVGFAIIAGIMLIIPSKNNAKRRQYQTIALYLSQKQGTLYYKREKDHEERKKEYQRHQRKHSYRALR